MSDEVPLQSSPKPIDVDLPDTEPSSSSHPAGQLEPQTEGPISAPRRRKTGFSEPSHGRNGSTSATLQQQTSRRSSNPRPSMSLLRRITSLTIPNKKIGPDPTPAQSLRAIVFASWLNILLVFVPVSWALHFVLDKSKSSSDTVIFVTAFLAIIPLAKLLAFGTEELALRVGQTLGGLLNATLGNVVELIVAIIALIKCELQVVQSSLVGSILSNLLLVLGMCFFAGGTKFSEQGFMATTAQLNTSLLILSVTAILIPAAFHVAISSTGAKDSNEGQDVLKMSHGVALILLIIYGCSLVFQLWSHAHLYDEDSGHAAPAMQSIKYPASKKVLAAQEKARQEDPEAALPEEAEDEEEIPQLSMWFAIGLLVIVTVFVAVTAEFLVSSIDGLTESGTISKEWVGLILLPIVGNAAEHVTAVTVSVKDKLDLSIGVAVGSSIQIALFVIPVLVVLSWILGKPLTLLFDPFESIVLFLSVLTVAFILSDGKSNWLEGAILMNLYVILAVAFWFYPGSDVAGSLLTCHS